MPVVKTDGNIRICGDFRVTVNSVLQDVTYPLPKIEDIFTRLTGGQHFTNIDLTQAYLQMEVEEESKKYLTVNTHIEDFIGTAGYLLASKLHLLSGNEQLTKVLQGIPGTEVLLDDVIVTGKTTAEHLSRLEMVQKRLQEKKEMC